MSMSYMNIFSKWSYRRKHCCTTRQWKFVPLLRCKDRIEAQRLFPLSPWWKNKSSKTSASEVAGFSKTPNVAWCRCSLKEMMWTRLWKPVWRVAVVQRETTSDWTRIETASSRCSRSWLSKKRSCLFRVTLRLVTLSNGPMRLGPGLED